MIQIKTTIIYTFTEDWRTRYEACVGEMKNGYDILVGSVPVSFGSRHGSEPGAFPNGIEFRFYKMRDNS
jgi:hypothetical protein